jgi:hypothetical protein
MVMRAALVVLLMLSACRQAEAPANKAAAAPPPPTVLGDVGTAEHLVRQRIGNNAQVRFTEVRRRAADGVPIICGAYQQGGARQRFIVVGGEEAFVEPQMRAGEMERAFGHYCTDGERG